MERFWNVSRSVTAAVVLGAAAGAQAQYQVAKLVADDGERYDRFGWGVSISGEYIVVGAPWDSDFGERSGSAYVFEKLRSGWGQAAKLNADDAAADDQFGLSVAIDRDVAAVGAPGAGRGGAVFVFERIGGEWIRTARLAIDQLYHSFGASVSVCAGTILVGEPGWGAESAYVFEKSDGLWSQEGRIDAPPGADGFGSAVAIDGATAFIGAPGQGNFSGVAYMFERIGDAWVQVAALDYGVQESGFGYALALDDGVAVAAGPWDYASSGPGFAHVFERAAGAWSQVARFEGDGGYDFFGGSVCARGDMLAIGAPFDNECDDEGCALEIGAVHLFTRSGGVWTPTAKLRADDFSEGADMGWSVGMSSDTIVAGAYYANGLTGHTGAVYLFSIPPCRTDFNGDGFRDTRDLIAFLNAWTTGDDLADWNQDGTIDTQDVLAFLNDWAGGC